jgi:AraC-like DNA-binding protein
LDEPDIRTAHCNDVQDAFAHSAPLIRMGLERIRRVGGYDEFAPPRDLAGVVGASWTYALPETVENRRHSHRILPELGVTLFFQCWRDGTGRVIDALLSVQGPIRAVQPFVPGPRLHIEGVRLHPEWTRALLGVDPSELANGVERYALVSAGRAHHLYERLVRTMSSAEAICALLDEVRERYCSVRTARRGDLARVATAMIRASDGTPLTTLARRLGITERHFRRIVHDATGIGAKQFQRVHRLNRAVALADRCANPAWARIAAHAGYYDQPHLIRELVALTGQTPSELHRERQAENL